MTELNIEYILTDIEGTTSDIRFVKEVLFPYAAQRLPDYIRRHEAAPEVDQELRIAAAELGLDRADLEGLIEGLLGWIEADLKRGSLKALQGQVWRDGYESGDFTGHLYADAVTHLKGWAERGIKLGVYSSGSVEAQRLLFRYSDVGDLSALMSDHFDTRVGHKRERASYENIKRHLLERGAISSAAALLFLSDVAEELDAAAEAGFKTAELRRDAERGSGRHLCCLDFAEVSARALLA